MYPIKKNVPLLNALFPFFLVFQDTKMPESELPDHLHDWHEIVYVYGGSGVFFIDNSFHKMDSGSLFIIPANTIHRAFPDSTNLITSTAVFFRTSLLSSESFGDRMPVPGMVQEWHTQKVYKLPLTARQQDATKGRLDSIQQEIHLQRFGYRQAVAFELQQLLIETTRASFNNASGSHRVADSVGPNWLTNAMQHIDANLTQTIYLSQLAKMANVSQPYFSKIFKQMTGLNLTKYITTKRIVRARELLEKSDNKIATISEDCGFYSLPHFHRTFLKYTGMTPTSYRKRKNVQP